MNNYKNVKQSYFTTIDLEKTEILNINLFYIILGLHIRVSIN